MTSLECDVQNAPSDALCMWKMISMHPLQNHAVQNHVPIISRGSTMAGINALGREIWWQIILSEMYTTPSHWSADI